MKHFLLTAILFIGLAACNSTGTSNNINNNIKNEKEMKPIELTKTEFLKKVANYETNPNEWKYLGDKPALIDFYANWCGPCKMIAPILEELAAEYADSIVIYKINTDKEQELAGVFGIQSIPSLLFVPLKGQPQMSMGAMSKIDLKRAINDILLGSKK